LVIIISFQNMASTEMTSGFVSIEDEEMLLLSQNRMRSKSAFCTKRNCESQAVYFYPSRCLRHLGLCRDCTHLHAMFSDRCDACRNRNNECRKKLRRKPQKKSSPSSAEFILIE
jgi:hypothetical protein